MMSIDSIATLLASLALLLLALNLSAAPKGSGLPALHDFQIANDAAEVLFKGGALSEFAEYSRSDSQAVPDFVPAQLERITMLTGRCIALSAGAEKEISTCPPSHPVARTSRLVPHQGGVTKVYISMGPKRGA